MVKPNMKHAIALMLLGVLVLSAQPVASSPMNSFTSAQITEPFEEMMTGVYVATQWWNDSSEYWYNETYYDMYEYYYYVEDTSGNVFWIEDTSVYDIYDEWDYSNLMVVVILDPDASVMAWLATHDWTDPYPTDPYPTDPGNYTEPGNYSDPVEPVQTVYVTEENGTTYSQDLWTLFWNPPVEAMTGDEVFVYSSFYFNSWYSDIYMESNYTWYDENWEEVDPNSVIPNLAEEYEWASWMNESWIYDEEWSYYGYGYDITEMTLVEDQVQTMDHYFSGMSVFNDTNQNGIMDMSYIEVEYDFDEDGIIDWTSYELDHNTSEILFDFYSNEASLGEVNLPAINDNGQIEWSAQVTDVKGDLWSSNPMDIYGADSITLLTYDEVDPIPAEVEYLEMVYRFEVTDEAAVVKIDQHIGDFVDPVTGNHIPELEGLGLTMNYWSSFSSYGIIPETADGPVDYTGVYEAEPAPQGDLDFVQEDEADFVTINFGGTYVWGLDGGTYDVGTVILPNFYYCMPCYEEGADAASVSSGDAQWAFSTFYYSSCYSNWGGYEIVHDPIYAVYPMIAPGHVSSSLNGLVTASWVLGGVGIIALALVCARNNSLRKMQ
ncbi:MAG: hypothetical protein ACW98Y_04750 [Candidatus Thorarchaeota archaeon]|jgi:hypothetical protein